MRINNNYESYKSEFKKDTGLEYSNKTISEYLQYLNFRVSDQQNQLSHQTYNSIQHIPENVRIQISQMLLTHEKIKELMNLLDKHE